MADFFKFTTEHDRSIQNYKNALVFKNEDLQKYKDIMSIFDTDGDNALNSSEIKSIWHEIRIYSAKDGNEDELSKAEAEDLIINVLKNWKINASDLISFISNVTSTLNDIEKKRATSEVSEELSILGNGVAPKEKYTLENLKKYYPEPQWEVSDEGDGYYVIKSKEETITIDILYDGRASIIKNGSSILESADGKAIKNSAHKPISVGNFMAEEIYNDFNSIIQNNTPKNLNNLIKHIKDINPENVKGFLDNFKYYALDTETNKTQDFFEYIKNFPNISNDKKEILISHVKKCLEKAMGYNETYFNMDSQVKNKYYTGDSYAVARHGDFINIVSPERPWQTYDINLAELVKDLPIEQGIQVKKMIQELPGEVLVDLAIELKNCSLDDGQSEKNQAYEKLRPKLKGYRIAAWYSPKDDNITIGVSGNYASKNTLVHELGHAVDYNGRFFNTASSESSKIFDNTFASEMKQYLAKGYKAFDGGENTDYKEGSSYATYNKKEMFAECYTLMMTGYCDSKQVIEEHFPKTLKAVGTLIKEIRAMEESKRRSG